jgi:mono/diheme cytochrome c family protein
MKKISMTLGSVMLGLALVGCGGGGGGEEGGGGDVTAGGEVPAEYQGAITGDATAGAELYDQACGSCHPGSAPDLAGIAWSAAATRQQIREGDDEMPPFPESRISAEDMENILAHMVTIGAVTE